MGRPDAGAYDDGVTVTVTCTSGMIQNTVQVTVSGQ